MFSDEFGKLRRWGCNVLEHRFFLYRCFYPRRNRKYWRYWQGQWCRLVAPSSIIRLPNNKFTLLSTSTWVMDLDFGACTAVPGIPFFSSSKLLIKVHAINSCYFRATKSGGTASAKPSHAQPLSLIDTTGLLSPYRRFPRDHTVATTCSAQLASSEKKRRESEWNKIHNFHRGNGRSRAHRLWGRFALYCNRAETY